MCHRVRLNLHRSPRWGVPASEAAGQLLDPLAKVKPKPPPPPPPTPPWAQNRGEEVRMRSDSDECLEIFPNSYSCHCLGVGNLQP